MKPLALLACFAFSATAAAQTTTAPAQEAPKPRPPLKLNLDEVEPARPRITFGAAEEKKDKKDEPASSLPGLGGRPSGVWTAPAKSVFPPNTGGAEGPLK